MELEKYLEMIQKDESIFPMDSFPDKKKKRKKILRVMFPNEGWMVLEQRRVMIDFDKTIYKYSKGYGDGTLSDEPFKDAKQVIDWLKNKGFEIVIFTTRASKENSMETGGNHNKEIQNIENWLKDNGIYFDRITSDKLAADFYIDDKAITIIDGNWKSVLKAVKKGMKNSQ
jgi:hypothetical protein